MKEEPVKPIILYSLAHFQSYINLNTIEVYFTEPLQKTSVFTENEWKNFRPAVNRCRELTGVDLQKP